MDAFGFLPGIRIRITTWAGDCDSPCEMFAVSTYGPDRGVNWRSAGFVLGLILGGELAVLQAAMFDGLSLDAMPLGQDCGPPSDPRALQPHHRRFEELPRHDASGYALTK